MTAAGTSIPGDLLVDEAQGAGRAQDRDRRDQRGALGEPGRLGGRATKSLEHLGPVADLQLEEARARAGLHQRALDAVLDRRGGGVLHRADEQPRRGLERPSGEVAALGQHARQGDELGAVEVEDAPGLGLVARRHVVAGEGDEVLDAVHRGADDVGLQREAIAVAADELHDRLDAALLQGDGHRERRGVGVGGRVVGRVDRVEPVLHGRELAAHLGQAAAVDRRHLGRDHPLPGAQLVLKRRHASPPACAGRVR